jgi:hypothetical protein
VPVVQVHHSHVGYHPPQLIIDIPLHIERDLDLVQLLRNSVRLCLLENILLGHGVKIISIEMNLVLQFEYLLVLLHILLF